jgi:uncharacterized protein YdhG (YjbR/CyaY superfamily)
MASAAPAHATFPLARELDPFAGSGGARRQTCVPRRLFHETGQVLAHQSVVGHHHALDRKDARVAGQRPQIGGYFADLSHRSVAGSLLRLCETASARSGCAEQESAVLGQPRWPSVLDCAAVSASEIDEYLRGLGEPKRATLQALRRTILEIVPEAEQVLSYRVPAFRVEGDVIAGFAAFKEHLSYLPFSGSVLGQLEGELRGYTRTKSALHFPVDRSLPKTLVKKLIAMRLDQIRQGLR